jgi:hypothetical protein
VVEAEEAEDSLPNKLLMSVEKAQRTSSDLLEDLRIRRVKARVKDASAALDAALATSATSATSKSTGGGRRAPPSIIR